jgi:hypothetical protein
MLAFVGSVIRMQIEQACRRWTRTDRHRGIPEACCLWPGQTRTADQLTTAPLRRKRKYLRCHYDSVHVSHGIDVTNIRHLCEEAVRSCSDHSLVIVV